MAWVTQQFIDTWRGGQHVGPFQPRCVVETRKIHYLRDYHTWPGDPVRASIPGETEEKPWYPLLDALTNWREIPNVRNINVKKSTDQNGLKTATVELENVVYVEQLGPGGTYHQIERGHFAPWRGQDTPKRPNLTSLRNDWYGTIVDMAEVRIWQGFGDPVRDTSGEIVADGGPNGAWTFIGMIDDVDLDDAPVTVQLTCRAGAELTDQRIFGWNKSGQLRDPITFCDRAEVDAYTQVGYNAKSSSFSGFTASNAVDSSQTTYWESAHTSDAGHTEWVEIRVPEGRYAELEINTEAGMLAYVGVKPRPMADGTTAAMDGVSVDTLPYAGGWIDDNHGDVPSTNGGWPYCADIQTTLSGAHTLQLGHTFEMGKDSVIRVGFQRLQGSSPNYRARVYDLQARKLRTTKQANQSQWILTDEVSDIVRNALRWAGYTQWEVENTGVAMPNKQTFNRSQYLIDIIKWAQDYTGFTFFLADADTRDSRGIPTFRRPATLLNDPGAVVAEVSDKREVAGFKPKIAGESRAYIIRVRGKEAAKKSGGRTLGGDKTRRLMYVYRPPWTHTGDMGGIDRHLTFTKQHLRSLDECKMAAYLIAIAEAVTAAAGVVDMAANPNIELDDQLGIIDTGTGMNSRLWVTGIDETMELGEDASWKGSYTASLIDNPYLVEVLADLVGQTFAKPAKNPIADTGTTRVRRIRL